MHNPTDTRAKFAKGYHFAELKLNNEGRKRNRVNFSSMKIMAENISYKDKIGHIKENSSLHKYLESFSLDFDEQNASLNPILVTEGNTKSLIFHYHGSQKVEENKAT